jgi:flagellar motor switch protein FliN/FliY
MVQNPAMMAQSAAIEEFADELTTSAEETAAAFAMPGMGDLGGDAPAFHADAMQDAGEPSLETRNLDVVMRIPVSVKIVLGSTSMPVANLLKLKRGAVIPLDRKVGEPVEVVVNGRVVARGDVVVIDEGSSRFGVSLTEIISPSSAVKA